MQVGEFSSRKAFFCCLMCRQSVIGVKRITPITDWRHVKQQKKLRHFAVSESNEKHKNTPICRFSLSFLTKRQWLERCMYVFKYLIVLLKIVCFYLCEIRRLNHQISAFDLYFPTFQIVCQV